jgi:rhamnulokinase
MSQHKSFLAVDLGASGGRVLAGSLGDSKLVLEELHRFENGGLNAGGHLHWNTLKLWSDALAGLRMAPTKVKGEIVGVGVDTWGVDYVLITDQGELVGQPYHYRDRRTAGIFEKAFEIVSKEEVFEATGLQFMEINTLFQLVAAKLSGSPLLDAADHLLMMPDYFHWLLTGEFSNEMTDVSTSQLFDPRSGDWSRSLIEKFGLPNKLFGEVTAPGTNLGKLRSDIASQTGLTEAEVVLPGTHDTASAVLAVPAESSSTEKPDWCYISSGTWSLMGLELSSPIINANCLEKNFTNEGGIGGTTRLLKNIGGLWLVQECRRIWSEQGHDFGWGELVRRAESASPLVSLINPDHPDFMAPADMPEAIRTFCKRTGQPVPNSEGAIIRCALESLALRYRQVLHWLEELADTTIRTIHIVGGGTQNTLLCQMAADACHLPVLAGPVEATATGNVLMQAISFGELSGVAEARELVKRSFEIKKYEPRQQTGWQEAYARFQALPV